MNKICGNDMLELWGYKMDGRPHVTWHDRVALDGKGKLLIELVKMSLHTAPLVDAMSNGTALFPPPSPEQLVMKAAETVDAIYDEARRRGWTIDLPAYDELDT